MNLRDASGLPFVSAYCSEDGIIVNHTCVSKLGITDFSPGACWRRLWGSRYLFCVLLSVALCLAFVGSPVWRNAQYSGYSTSCGSGGCATAVLPCALMPFSRPSPSHVIISAELPFSTLACSEHRTNLRAAATRIDGVLIWPGKPLALLSDVLLPLRPENGYCIGPDSTGPAVCLGAGVDEIIHVIEKLAGEGGLSTHRVELSERSRFLLPGDSDLVIETFDQAAYTFTSEETHGGCRLSVHRQPLDRQSRQGPFPQTSAATQVRPHRIVIAAVGDMMLGGAVGTSSMRVLKAQLGPAASLLGGADIAVGNLEAPLTDARLPTHLKTPRELATRAEFVFRAQPQVARQLLQYLGIDAVSLANNHMLDYRAKGIEDTFRHLAAAGIQGAGAGDSAQARQPLIIERNGLKCGVLSYVAEETLPRPSTFKARPNQEGLAVIDYDDEGPSADTRTQLIEDIDSLNGKADLAILALHWGIEGSSTPTVGQRRLAQFCIDSGADMVWGHHPHCLQPIELYKGKLISYSMGNFIFNTPPRSHLLRTGILVTCFDTRGLTAASLVPGAITRSGHDSDGGVPGIPQVPDLEPNLVAEITRDLGFPQ